MDEHFVVRQTTTYNALLGMLEIQYPSCRYEKSIYSTLLVVSVVIILLGIVLQFLQKLKIPVQYGIGDEKSNNVMPPKKVCGSMNAAMSTIKDGAFRLGIMQESGGLAVSGKLIFLATYLSNSRPGNCD